MNQTLKSPITGEEGVAIALACDGLLYRVSLKKYHDLIETEIFQPEDRVELLQGILVNKMTHHPPHASTTTKAGRKFFRIVPEKFEVRIQCPITLKDSEPEPDIAVAEGPSERYVKRHPGAHDTHLLVEVAERSLTVDRHVKGPIYAQARIPVYWIINLVDEIIEVYTDPRAGKSPGYQMRQDYGKQDRIPLRFAGQDFGEVAVKDLLP
jgi:Uma2 family endonuclease